jgi:23S rRNA (uracil1939-C5)-methyltransferase
LPETFEITPEKLVYGGETLGHHAGKTILTPLALPGEQLRVEVRRVAKGVVRAQVLEVLVPSGERVHPPCPYFGECGGCQLQHLRAEVQPGAKREILRETLRRLGKVQWKDEIRMHASTPWGYRNQAQLKIAGRENGGAEVGFFASESHRLIPIEACTILSPRLNQVLSVLRQQSWPQGLGKCTEIDLLADDRDSSVFMTIHGILNAAEAQPLASEMLAKIPEVIGVAVQQQKGWRVFGEPGLVYHVANFRYRVSPGAFFQASRFLLEELTAAVCETPEGMLALDLFAGVGLFTLPLASRFQHVIGVESVYASARDLEANAREHALGNIRVVASAVFDFLRRFAQTGPDLVVMDPPRAGVDSASLKLLAALQPHAIHYVSCSPPTLARDLEFLIRHGYELNSVELFDLFPQTYHVETLARLTRRPV